MKPRCALTQEQRQSDDETNRLLEIHAALRARLQAISRDIRRALEPDLETPTIPLQNDEVLEGFASAAAAALARMEARLAELA